MRPGTRPPEGGTPNGGSEPVVHFSLLCEPSQKGAVPVCLHMHQATLPAASSISPPGSAMPEKIISGAHALRVSPERGYAVLRV